MSLKKVRILSDEHCKEVQQAFFNEGIFWLDGTKHVIDYKNVKMIKSDYFGTMVFDRDPKAFDNSSYPEYILVDGSLLPALASDGALTSNKKLRIRL